MANQHVVKRDEGWAVLKEGSERDTAVLTKQEDAWDLARQIAKNQGSDAFLHDRHGKFRERSSYGNDPYPPIG
jgi:hypothetical protein